MFRIISAILIFTLTSSSVLAQEAAVKSLVKGDRAPFNGTLMNQEAVGDLLFRLNSSEKICDAKIEKQFSIQKSSCDLSLDKLKAANDFQISVYKNQNVFLKCQIDISVKQLEKSNVAAEWWFAGGFALGALATIAAGYLIIKAGE